ncbi:MAG TPA: 30S ribosomal protein S8e [Nitrosopumilaceae archaeon]|nr:30S ribosomal protein S8e [Nitrosopumilaceae archaeon]
MRKAVENLATSKLTGGRRHPLRIRRKYEMDRYPNEPLTGAQETVTRKVRGKNQKTGLKTVDFVNLSSPNSKVKKTKIIKVLENPTNNDYQRRGVITKGAILETQEGKCKVVSRPGQDGIVNAVLIK